MFIGEFSFEDGNGAFAIFRMIWDEYMGVMLGRPTKVAGQWLIFTAHGIRKIKGPSGLEGEIIHFENAVTGERIIMRPSPVIEIAPVWDENRFLTSDSKGIYRPRSGAPVRMVFTGRRSANLVEEA